MVYTGAVFVPTAWKRFIRTIQQAGAAPAGPSEEGVQTVMSNGNRWRGWRKRSRSSNNGYCVEVPCLEGKEKRPPESVPDTDRHGFADLVAFVGILMTGTALVLIGHVATGGLSTACLALGGLYVVWSRSRKRPHQ
jgi:hypothetical protein